MLSRPCWKATKLAEGRVFVRWMLGDSGGERAMHFIRVSDSENSAEQREHPECDCVCAHVCVKCTAKLSRYGMDVCGSAKNLAEGGGHCPSSGKGTQDVKSHLVSG